MPGISEFIETECGEISRALCHLAVSHSTECHNFVSVASPSWLCCFTSLRQCFDSILVPVCLSQMGAVLRIKPGALWEPSAALPAAPLIGHQREGVWSDQVPADGAQEQQTEHNPVILCAHFGVLSISCVHVCTHTTSCSSSLVSGEGLMRM